MKLLEDLPIQIDREKIAAFCRARGIQKMSLFGSVVRDDFDPERSDVDVLAEFAPHALDGVGWDYFGYAEELEQIMGRKVDFCSRLSKYVLPLVKPELLPIYEQT
jgi:predicted nucleotidyltransferase